jgi:predicted glycosyltransferase
MPETLRPLAIKVSPEQIHDLLHYASLYIGEGATMATEAALLGTPSIYVSTLVGTMGNFDELMERYQLVYSYYDPEQALEKALSLLENNAKVEWQERRNTLLGETIDVTEMTVEAVCSAAESSNAVALGTQL